MNRHIVNIKRVGDRFRLEFMKHDQELFDVMEYDATVLGKAKARNMLKIAGMCSPQPKIDWHRVREGHSSTYVICDDNYFWSGK